MTSPARTSAELVRAAMTRDEHLDDIKRARIWSELENQLAEPVRAARRWPFVFGAAAAGMVAAAAIIVLVVRPTAPRDNALAVPAGTSVTAQVGPHTRASLVGPARLELDAVGEATTVHLHRGTLLADFAGGNGRSLSIVAPDARIEIVGTLFAVEVRDGAPTCTSVEHGRVRVTTRGQAVFVAAGQRYCVAEATQIDPIAPSVHEALERHAAVLTANVDAPVVAPAPAAASTAGVQKDEVADEPAATAESAAAAPAPARSRIDALAAPRASKSIVPSASTAQPRSTVDAGSTSSIGRPKTVPSTARPTTVDAASASSTARPKSTVPSASTAPPKSTVPSASAAPPKSTVPPASTARDVDVPPTSTAPGVVAPTSASVDTRSEPARDVEPAPQPVSKPAPQPPQPPQLSAADLYQIADAALAKRDLAAADRALATLVAVHRDSKLVDQALFDRARIAHQRRDWRAARAHIAAMSSKLLAEPAHWLRCRVDVDARDTDARTCLTDYRVAFPKSPHDLDALALLARLAHATGGCAAAAMHVDELALRYPRTTLAAGWRARCPSGPPGAKP